MSISGSAAVGRGTPGAAAARGQGPAVLGQWLAGAEPAAFEGEALLALLPRVREALHVVWSPERRSLGLAPGGTTRTGTDAGAGSAGPGAERALLWIATLPPLYPEWLGDPAFRTAHGVRFGYVAGEMAGGIATAEMVTAMARARLLGFFGAAGLAPDRVEREIDAIEHALGGQSAAWGSNLIHSPADPAAEEAMVDLYLRRGVRRVSASAFMDLRPSVVRLAATGLRLDPGGRLERRHHVMAKVSRPEVAAQFASPAPRVLLESLVASGSLRPEEAELAARVPVAEDVTVEADSGGHTDNRPLTVLLPAIRRVCEDLAARHGYAQPVRVGAAGGLGTPEAVAAAFAMGAAYVLTGSINQVAVESGLSEAARRLLAEAGPADVAMAPAADMFELGVRVQVLRRGTLYAARASQLYDLYRTHDSLESIPAEVRRKLERDVFRASLEDIWAQTRAFFAARDPERLRRAEADPHQRMALVFRWYLGMSSRWAIAGDPERRVDYQIWCGPAMGAFNAWTAESFLAEPGRRGAVQIALNLLEGAAVVTRAQQLRACGIPLPPAAFRVHPRPLR